MNWWLTGDTHGCPHLRIDNLLEHIEYVNTEKEETALIILGDAGFNFYLNKKDKRLKKETEAKGIYVYCVRGNHEARPQHIKGMKRVYDANVMGDVWMEEEYPHIRYFDDWGIYVLGTKRVLVIGGAYSVDKFYRLQNDWMWFGDEQLTENEMRNCAAAVKNQCFDMVLSHTCPWSFQPTDLFLSVVDQSSVDNTMERWMDDIKDTFNWGVWCFGHYHADRIENLYVEQFFTEITSLDEITHRWREYAATGNLHWWLPKSPRLERILEGEQA